MHGTYDRPKGMRKDGTKPTTYGPASKGDAMPVRGPGASSKRKGSIPANRVVGGKRGK